MAAVWVSSSKCDQEAAVVFQRSCSGRFCALLPFHDGGWSSSTLSRLVDFLGPAPDGVGGEVTLGNPEVSSQVWFVVRPTGLAHLFPPFRTRGGPQVCLPFLPMARRCVAQAGHRLAKCGAKWASSDASLVSVAPDLHVSGSIGAPRRAIGTPSTRSQGHN